MPVDRNGVLQREFIVTFQANFKLVAQNDHQAEQMVMRAMNVGMGMAPQLLGLGVQAQPVTDELLAQLGFTRGPKA